MGYVDFSVILNALGKLIGAIVATAILYLVPVVKNWIIEKLGEVQARQLFDFIRMCVEAAEQKLRESDPDGTLRKQYVKDKLLARGVEYTAEIDAFVEGLVYELNRDKTDVGKNDVALPDGE